jgi:hypothetical protein
LFNNALLEKKKKFDDIVGVERIRKSKDRQHNGQNKKDKQDLQNTTQKTKDRAIRAPLKTGGELM